jgi:AhpD family alkylhydroperoxidase
MEPRIDYSKHAPEAQKAMFTLEKYIFGSGLDHKLIHLMKLRASQINGCAFCIDMHSKDARALGETEQRLYALDAWRETPFFTGRERAALEGPSRSPWFPRPTCRMKPTKRCVNTSAKRKSSI